MLRRVKKGTLSVEYDLRKTDRKSVECRVGEDGVVVFAPLRMPARDADRFVEERIDWILEATARIEQHKNQARERLENAMQDGTIVSIEGKEYALRLLPGASNSIRLTEQTIEIAGADSDAETVREALRRFLIDRAMERVKERVGHFSGIIGKRPGRVTLREQKTKWGSCSSRGNLNFNWKLIMAPPGALDYVVVHELCHMIELNHSPAFWALVEKYMPDWREWKQYLDQVIRSLF